ncbi:hypothetical protein [Amycolatopsis suaedae]|uniref:Uncharacterized protein n=1 Tax=Amycolatopsis suaedae TaxID=2510978 RepID=A0A4Q7JFN3_9PSEU|nr:hypothetical protein [Amycolatopsis suaedae]RZQ65404.1 hypothetical protein EWH70_05915 [Amycolatopsis suaedae]
MTDDQPRNPDGTYASKGKLFVAAAAVGGVVAAGGGGVAVTSGTAGSSAGSSIGQSVRAKANTSKKHARKGNAEAAWRQLGMRSLRRQVRQAANCALNSYGEVRQFFLRTPCRSLKRQLLVVGDGAGNSITVAVAWVRMRDAAAAGRLRSLADRDGTGNVAALGQVDAGPFTGEYYDSDRRGTTTVIAEAAPAGGRPDGDAMQVAAEVAVNLPP